MLLGEATKLLRSRMKFVYLTTIPISKRFRIDDSRQDYGRESKIRRLFSEVVPKLFGLSLVRNKFVDGEQVSMKLVAQLR